MRNYLTEFIGTFFLVLTVCLSVTLGAPLAAIAIGLSLMVMVYMGGHVSGGHYNPAVTLAATLRGALPAGQAIPYMIAQIAGALVAALTAYAALGRTMAPAPGDPSTITAIGPLLIEILYTFALCIVVLSTATAAKTKGNSYYGLAIGLTVTTGAIAGGPISGGAFNPAVGIGPTVVNAMLGGGSFQHLWLYIVGPFVGGFLASLVFRLQGQD